MLVAGLKSTGTCLITERHKRDFLENLKACIRKISPCLNDYTVRQVCEDFLQNNLVFNTQYSEHTNHLLTVSDCRFIDLHSGSAEGPPCSFGSHSNLQNCNILIGYLEIEKKFGVVLLKDAHYAIACIIIATDKGQLSHFLNKYVMVKNFRVFTESYNDTSVMNLEYLYFDISDVEIVKSRNWECGEFLKLTNRTDLRHKLKLTFRLLRKSSVCVSSNGCVEIWLEIATGQMDGALESQLLCLGPQLIDVGLLLEPGKNYVLHHSKQREKYINFEIQRCKPQLKATRINEDDAYFTIIKEDENDEHISNVDEALKNLNNYSQHNLICFKGKLESKKLVTANSSRTRTTKEIKGFGTPGKKTHVLEFLSDGGSRKLTMYLNNWERMQIPLGLLPEMEIIIRNVVVQSKKYFKSTAFTYFDIVRYKPKVPFDTANLCSDVSQGWNSCCYIGFGDLLPDDILIWAKIHFIKIRSLRIYVSCPDCKCRCFCDSEDKQIRTMITCRVRDEVGEAHIISKSLELLRLLLDLERKQWIVWCKAFENVEEYNYEQSRETENVRLHGDLFKYALTQLIQCINATNLIDLVLKCRKLHHKVDDNDGLSLWYCIDAKKSSV